MNGFRKHKKPVNFNFFQASTANNFKFILQATF